MVTHVSLAESEDLRGSVFLINLVEKEPVNPAVLAGNSYKRVALSSETSVPSPCASI